MHSIAAIEGGKVGFWLIPLAECTVTFYLRLSESGPELSNMLWVVY